MRKKGIGWMFLSIALIAFIEYHGITLADDLEPMDATGTSTVRVCLPPAWSLKLNASQRFTTVLGGEAVLDWEKSPDTTTRTWADAVAYAYTKEVGGRKGWRLPTVEELASLVDTSVSGNPKLPSGHPFTNVQSGYDWSSTTFVYSTSYAWNVYFGSGTVGYDVDKSYNNDVWCVRGGHGYDAR